MAQHEDGIDLDHLSTKPEAPKKPPRSGEIVAKGSLGKDFYDKPSAQGGTSVNAMARTLSNMSLQPTPQLQEVGMQKTVDVKCNYARGQTVVQGDLILTFNEQGICKMPRHQLPQLAQIQRVRPGRFIVLEDTASKPPVPKPQLKAKKVEPKALVVEDKPEVKETLEATVAEESEPVVEETPEELQLEEKPEEQVETKVEAQMVPIEAKSTGAVVVQASEADVALAEDEKE